MIYKESGIEWIGQVPNHWHTLSVSKAYDVTLGKMLQPNSNDENDVKVPYLKAMNVQDGYVSFEKIEEMYCSINELNNYKLECGDLVVCEGGEVARSAVIKENLAGFIFQNSVHRVKGTAKGDTRFLHYLLIALRASGFINILVNKATIAHFTKDKFNSLKIALPQLNEQLKISDYLDYKTYKIETLIKAKQMLIDLLEQQRQSIITEAVTKGLNPSVKMKDSGVEWIGEIPEHWSILPLKYIASEKKNSFVDGPFGSDLKNEEYVDSGVPVIQLNNIKNGKLRINNMNYVSEEKSEQLRRHTAYPDDLVIAKMASPIARSAVVPNMFQKYVIVADCVKLKLKENYSNAYINYAMNTPFTIAQAEAFANGTTRSRVNLGIIKNLKVPIPHFEEQKEIVSYLEGKISEMDNVIKSVEKQIEKLKEYRQSLIYEAVTGKIDVRDMELD